MSKTLLWREPCLSFVIYALFFLLKKRETFCVFFKHFFLDFIKQNLGPINKSLSLSQCMVDRNDLARKRTPPHTQNVTYIPWCQTTAFSLVKKKGNQLHCIKGPPTVILNVKLAYQPKNSKKMYMYTNYI